MAKQRQTESKLDLDQLLDKIFTSGTVTRPEYMQLTTTILSEKLITNEDRKQINRVFDQIHSNHIKIV